MIPDPIRLDRVIAEEPEPKYVTFINPQPDKGATVFARIALELGRRRPDIPLLVVEGTRHVRHAGASAGGPVGADKPEPDGQYAGPARLLPGKPGGADAVAVARVTRPGADRSDGQRDTRAGQRPRCASRDPGRCRVRLHDPRAMYALQRRGADGARGRALGGCLRTALGRPPIEASHRERALAEARRWDRQTLAERYERLLLGVHAS